MSSATIRVTFGDGSSTVDGAHLSAEIDSRAGGLNGGKTSFQPGDSVWFLVYKSDNVEITGVIPSAGSILQGSTFSHVVTSELEFAEETTATLPIPSEGISNPLWFGTDLGAPVLGSDKLTVTVPTKGVGVLQVGSTVVAHSYKLISPAILNGLYDFSILVLVKGSVVTA